MTPLAVIPLSYTGRARPAGGRSPRRSPRTHVLAAGPARLAVPERDGREIPPEAHRFTPLIDARAANKLLGVPYTWLLAQARERRIPHHRLGHYVRFNPDDLREWLDETRSTPLALSSNAAKRST